jgi:hypothetical protein
VMMTLESTVDSLQAPRPSVIDDYSLPGVVEGLFAGPAPRPATL